MQKQLAAADSIGTVAGSNSTVQQVKNAVRIEFGDAVTAVTRGLAQIEAAGVPDVANGQAAVAGLTVGIREVIAVLKKDEAKVQGFPNDPATFAADIKSMLAELSDFLSQISQTVWLRRNSPELHAILLRNPACSLLTS